MLSRRFLWYTPSGLFFECHTELARTEQGEKLTIHQAKAEDRPYLLLKSQLHVPKTSILDLWYHLIRIYSSTTLTNPSKDRILAISGLASEVRTVLSDHDAGISTAYLSGIWLGDIHHGLLWAQHSFHEKYVKACGAPSWSWASLLAEVVWPPRKKETKAACKITGLCLRERGKHSKPDIAIDRDELFLEAPSDTANGSSTSKLSPFGVENVFSCLHLTGTLEIVYARGYFKTEENIKRAAELSGRHIFSTNALQETWRAICHPSAPDIIIGWGSFERLEIDQACSDADFALHALHVSTTWTSSNFTKQKVLEVLFLNIHEDQRFSRLGVGQIFDHETVKAFEKSKGVEILLM